MDSKKDFSDIFDENFEVTYDGDPDISSDFPKNPGRAGYSGQQPSDGEFPVEDYESIYDSGGRNYNAGYGPEYSDDDYNSGSGRKIRRFVMKTRDCRKSSARKAGVNSEACK